ncbi:hypothetical protein AAE478_001066 [Parahypoxylon ruwenzoriense]
MPYTNTSICLTPACIQASAHLYNNLSPNFRNIDPCTNFEEVVCGGFRERHVIPEGRNDVRESDSMDDANYVLMRHILESPYNTTWDSPGSVDEQNFKKLVTGYNACMNETAIRAQGIQPLVSFLENITESFPITPEEYGRSDTFSSKDYKSFSKTYLFLTQHGIDPFLGLSVSLDPTFPETYIPAVQPGGVLLPLSIYEDKEARSQYEGIVAQVFAEVLPSNETKAAAKDLARELVDLEHKIISNQPTLSNDDMANVLPLDNVTQLAPEFDLASAFRTFSSSPLNRTLYPVPEWTSWLHETLANSSKPAIQSFFLWKAISSFQTAVDSPEIDPLKQFLNLISGRDANFREQRWRTCITDAAEKTAWLISKPYLEVRYTEAIDKTLEEMTRRIQRRLASNIDHIDWMTDKVKAIAKQKVEAITPKLGYPKEGPNAADAESIAEYYSGLNITDSFFNNAVLHSEWASHTAASLIGTKGMEKAWPLGSGSALTINAFYFGQENAIIIAGTLQQLLLDPAVPSYLNYGALGTVIGHEFTHSLDSNGRLFDDRGAYTDWWDDESEAGFNKQAECLIEQYGSNNLTIDGEQRPVDGNLTLSENIADTGGVNTAWDAWMDKRAEDPASDFDLPGLRDYFTHEQLFFVAASQFFCGAADDHGKEASLADVHSPPNVRIKSMTENSGAFREAFNCPVKEPTCVIY